MKNKIKLATMTFALGLSAWSIAAQDAGGPPPDGDRPPLGQGPGASDGSSGGRHHRPLPPIIAALDTNHDGVIDASEIANASAALMTLDKNGDGKLTMEELLGPPRLTGEAPMGQVMPPAASTIHQRRPSSPR